MDSFALIKCVFKKLHIEIIQFYSYSVTIYFITKCTTHFSDVLPASYLGRYVFFLVKYTVFNASNANYTSMDFISNHDCVATCIDII